MLLGGANGVCQIDDASAFQHAIPGAVPTPAPPPSAPTPAAAGSSVPSAAAAAPMVPMVLPQQDVLVVSVSPDGAFVAVYTADGHVHVFSAGAACLRAVVLGRWRFTLRMATCTCFQQMRYGGL